MENSAILSDGPARRAPTGAGTPVRPTAGQRDAHGGGADGTGRARVAPRWSGRLWRGTSLGLLLIGVGCLYLIGLSASGWANSFYSAAAQAASQSWEALFFGSSDAANFITVDKPPAFLWIIGLSVRIFGVNSWAILVPEALEGVAAVAVLYATLRRVLSHAGSRGATASTGPAPNRPAPNRPVPNGPVSTEAVPADSVPTEALRNRAHWAAMAGAAVFATVPSATLMFRYNNPDALLVLLLVIAAYCTLRACEKGSRGWLAWAGAAVGFAFLTKMMQAFLVLPPLVVVYAIAAPRGWGRKIVDLLVALATMVVSAGWYIAIFELVPTSWRPYMGGSQTNSFLELVFGYNGFGRLTGNETGSVVPGGTTGAGSWGRTGITRLFDGTSAGMVTWLIPAALILSVVAVVLIGRRGWANLRRRDRSAVASTPSTQALAGVLAMAGSLLVTLLTFSFMSGIYHDYYTVALAPWIGGSVALGAAVCWSHRDRWTGRIALAGAMAVSSAYAVHLLGQAGGSWMILAAAAGVAGAVAALGLLLGHLLPGGLARACLALAVAAGLAGPLGYSVETAATPHTGAIVTAGPVSGGMAGMGAGPGGRGMGVPGRTGGAQGGPGAAQAGSSRQAAGSRPGSGTQGGPAGGRQGEGPTAFSTAGRPGGAGGMGGMGGLNGATEVSSAAKTLLSTGANSYTWVAAVTGSNAAASYQLATGHPVMAIGGYNGTDPAPTLSQFKQLVAEGRIHYYISSGTGGSASSGSDASTEIASWVAENFSSKTVGNTTFYDLSQAAS